MRKKGFISLFVSAALLAAVFANPALAVETKFRKDFRTSYEQNRFDALGFLVRANKAIIPGEIKSLLEEAAKAETFADKMTIIDLASAMGTMYKEWHGDAKPLEEVEKIQKEELRKEEARKAEIEKWMKYDAFSGNFVMKASMPAMQAKGLSPVVFPHWVHRLYYDCKACHPDLFQMMRTDAVNHAAMAEGNQCGACHNGKISFSASAKESCDRCHVVEKPNEAALLQPKKADTAKLGETAKRLGVKFEVDKLPNAALPFEKMGNIDWLLLRKALSPIKSLKADYRDETKDSVIIFEPPMDYVKDVLFRHKTHTDEVRCSSCHPDIYKDELGSTTVGMKAMSSGQSCGACHGKVAFRFADCNRCHTHPQKEPAPAGVLLRKKQQ